MIDVTSYHIECGRRHLDQAEHFIKTALTWLDELGPALATPPLSAGQRAFENFPELTLVDVVDTSVGANDSAHDGTVGVCVSAKHHCLLHGPVVNVFDWLAVCTHEAVDRENEGVLGEAHVRLDIECLIYEEVTSLVIWLSSCHVLGMTLDERFAEGDKVPDKLMNIFSQAILENFL